tara:strand:+ start:203 stop:628 length:426 start_codon:yes stop_codon:yes gene_type:complete
MSIQYQKISGNSETILDFTNYAISTTTTSYNDYTEENINNIVFNREHRLVNVHATDSVSVDLYIKYYSDLTLKVENDYTDPTATTNTIYYLKNMVIPSGVSLVLEKGDLIYPYSYQSTLIDGPYIKLDQSDSAVDVITTNY